MIIFLLGQAIINIIGTILTPLGFVNNILTNVLVETPFIALVRFSTFFINEQVLTFAIDTLAFWSSAFLLRPLVNFIRNKS